MYVVHYVRIRTWISYNINDLWKRKKIQHETIRTKCTADSVKFRQVMFMIRILQEYFV